MVDFRYHLASLSAVFLALFIGILIGNSFVGLASADKQQKYLAQEFSDLKRELSADRSENERLQNQLKAQDDDERTLLDTVVGDSLRGRRLAVIACGRTPDPSVLSALSGALETMGATVASTTTVEDGWLDLKPADRARVLARLRVPAASDGADGMAARRLGQAIATGVWSRALKDVASACPGLHLDSSGDYSAPVAGVVILSSGRTDDSTDGADAAPELRLVDGVRSIGARCVVATADRVPDSLSQELSDRGVPAVPNAVSTVGQIALAVALVPRRERHAPAAAAPSDTAAQGSP